MLIEFKNEDLFFNIVEVYPRFEFKLHNGTGSLNNANINNSTYNLVLLNEETQKKLAAVNNTNNTPYGSDPDPSYGQLNHDYKEQSGEVVLWGAF